jgi:hypothetical protein
MTIPPRVAQRVFDFKSAKLRIFVTGAARAVRIRILAPRTTPLLRRRGMLFPCHALDDVRLYRFKRRSVVRESLGAEMGFEFQEQLGAFGFARAFEGHALVVVRGRGGRGAKFRTAHALQPRENFPCQLVDQNFLSSGASAPQATSGHGFSRADSPQAPSGVLTPEGLRPCETRPKPRTSGTRWAPWRDASSRDCGRGIARAIHNPRRLECDDR